ncbi:uncharacterized protein ACIQIH_018385 [Cyanocitta cristata]
MAPVVRGSSAVSPGPQGAMGRQRAPPGPCWRRLLRAGCWWLLSLCGTALRGLRGLWSLTWVGTSLGTSPHLCRLQTWRAGGAGAGELWGASAVPLVLGLWFVATGAAGGGQCVTTAPGSSAAALAPSSRGAGPWLKALCGCAHQEPWGHGDSAPGSALHRAGVSRPLPQVLLICYKSCWDGAFQVTEELGTALQLRLEGSEEEEDGDSDSALEPGQTVVGLQQRGDASEAMLRRLEALEADVRFLCTELGAEKLLWSSRFLELLREQQSLHQRLQELPWQWNRGDSPELLGEAEDQSASGSEGESPEGRQWMEAPQKPHSSIQPDRQKM